MEEAGVAIGVLPTLPVHLGTDGAHSSSSHGVLFSTGAQVTSLYCPAMPDEQNRAIRRAMAASLVEAAAADAQAAGGTGRPLSATALETVTDAVAQDLGAYGPTVTEAFLTKVETQTQVIAEAVVILSKATEGLASAVKALREQITP